MEAGAGGLIMIMQASHYSGGLEVMHGCGGHFSRTVQFIFLTYIAGIEMEDGIGSL